MEEKADGTGAGARSILYKLQLKAPLSQFQLSNFSSELVCTCILTYLIFKSSDQLLGISRKDLAQKHIVLEKIQFLL